ncbi:MAG: S-layer homology domain-containing protein [Firmicutes bacterium]|nr:S-layer homology domain-containing protein [Bacillota bacterium]
MTIKMGKIYGIFFALIGLFIYATDTVLLGIESGFIRFSFNPAEIIGRYLSEIVSYSTRTISVVTSSIFSMFAIGLGIACFLLVRKNLKRLPKERNWTNAVITGGISVFFWFSHAILLYNSFIYFTEHRKCLDVLFFFNTLLLSFFTLLLIIIPSVKAKIFRRVLAFCLILMSIQAFLDVMYFGVLNIVFRHEHAAILPLLSLIAPFFMIAAGICFLEGKRVLLILEKLDKNVNCSLIFGPLVNLIDGKYETWAISDTITEEKPATGDVTEHETINQMIHPEIQTVNVKDDINKPRIQDISNETQEIENELYEAPAPAAPKKGLFKPRKPVDATLYNREEKITEYKPPIPTMPLPDMDLFKGDYVQVNVPVYSQTTPKAEKTELRRTVKTVSISEPQPQYEPATDFTTEDEEQDDFSKPLPENKKLPLIPSILILLAVIGISLGIWYFTAGPGSAHYDDKMHTLSKDPSASGKPQPKNLQNVLKISPDGEIKFDDIEKSTFREQIITLARLGITEDSGKSFKPLAPVTRAQYIRWLVKANNIYMPSQTGGFIKPAGKDSEAAFRDVAKNNKDWEWIQGLADAGYDLKSSGRLFEPDKNITRQEMVYIRCQIEYNISPKETASVMKNPKAAIASLSKYYDDAEKISPRYLFAFTKDMQNNFSVIKSCFGTTRLLKPQKKLTREEAAASIYKIKNTDADSVLKGLTN